MNFDLSDEQKMLADSAARYVRERCDLESRRQSAKSAEGFSRRHWQHFAAQGWLALTLPEAVGGLGLGLEEMAVLMEELGRGLVAEPLVDSAVLCGGLLAGTTRGYALLPLVASGEAILALAHLEQDGRAEYDCPVAASATPDGDGWRLDGVKHLVCHGAAASHLLVSAREAGAAGYSLFAVDAASTGITRDDYALIDGTRAADIRFNQVPVAAADRLHDAAGAADALGQALDSAIIANAAAALGAMEAVLELTADYLKTREQYGQPLASFQALKHRMAEMLVDTEQARSMLYCALAAQAGGGGDARRRAVSGAKALIAQAGLFVTGQGIQLHGGIGVTEEYAVGHHYKALQMFAQRFGDTDFHLQRRARLALEH